MQTIRLEDHMPKEHWESIKRDLDIQPGTPQSSDPQQVTSQNNKNPAGLYLANDFKILVLSKTATSQDYAATLLEEQGYRLMTYQETFIAMAQNLELKKRLNGKLFYLAGVGTELDGYYMIGKNGNLAPEVGENWEDVEKTVYVYPGFKPLVLTVISNDGMALRRFDIDGNAEINYRSPIVVGIKYDSA